MRKQMISMVAMMAILLAASNQAMAYDATFNFSHPMPSVVSGFRIKAGGAKGGPYPTVIQCGKPAAKSDGTYDCTGTGLAFDPMYAVAVAVDAAGQESAPSNEAVYDPPPPAPSGLKYTISGTITITPTN